MSNPHAASHPLPFIVHVPVVLGVVVYGRSKEEAEQTAQAQVDRHFGNSTQAQNAHLGDLPDITIARCRPQAPERVKVLVHLEADGQEPGVYCSAACDIAIVRTDKEDLADNGEEDIFKIPVLKSAPGETAVDAVGHIDSGGPPVPETRKYIDGVFAAIKQHWEADGAVESPVAQGDAP